MTDWRGAVPAVLNRADASSKPGQDREEGRHPGGSIIKKGALRRKTGLKRSGWGVRATGDSKFSNVPTTVLTDAGKRSFHSKLEADRYVELLTLERSGKISDLRTQVTLRLVVNGHLVCRMIPDFAYQKGGKEHFEDTKGVVTPEFRIKQKLAKALGWDVRVVKRCEVGRYNA